MLDLASYGIDLVSDGNACYVPLQTMSDFLLAIKYVNLFYNGEAAFFVPMDGFKDAETGGYSALVELFYSVEPKDRSEAMGEFSYKELCLAMDKLYGLKEVHGISSFDNLANQCHAREALMGTDPNAADAALYSIIALHFSDRHSFFSDPSPLSREGLEDELIEKVGKGPIFNGAMSQKAKYRNAREEAYPDHLAAFK